MLSGCVRWLLSCRTSSVFADSLGCWTPATRLGMCTVRSGTTASSCMWAPFCTDAGNAKEVPVEKKKKSLYPQGCDTNTSVGRKIPHSQIQVISDAGENLGTMHRSDVIRIMDAKDLKLVLMNQHKDPPLYKLMTGKQIHEEQVKLWEKKKSKAGPVQLKELTVSCGIKAHDLSTKVKQIESWLEKKNHIRVTLQARRGQPATNLVTALEEVVQQVGVMVGFVSKPKAIRDGRAAMCILRLPSAKELSQKGKSNVSDLQGANSNSSQDKRFKDTVATEDSQQ